MAVVEISGISSALSAAEYAGSFAISSSSVSACLSSTFIFLSVTMQTANILLFSAVLSLDYVLQKASARLTGGSVLCP